MNSRSRPERSVDSAVTELNQALGIFDHVDEQMLIDALAITYDIIGSIEPVYLQEFQGIDEAELSRLALARAATIEAGDLRVSSDPAGSLLDAAVLLRAMEQTLLGYCPRATELDIEEAWRTSDGNYFVIRGLTPSAKIEGRPFRRRALLHHRVIPTTAGGLSVRLHRLDHLSDSLEFSERTPLRVRRFGAAIFPSLTAHMVPETGEFVVDAVTGFDGISLIDSQIKSGVENTCSAIVWAELTMDDGAVGHLKASLTSSALERPHTFDFVVAGSWHRTLDGLMRNTGEVLTGSGDHICHLVKWSKYKLDQRREAIEPGHEIPVLVGEEELVVLAICKDFLADDDKEPPYGQLNVDLAVVPSMGDLKTLWGHAATATKMRARYGTLTLVVQQPSEPLEGLDGFVLNFPRSPFESIGSTPVKGPFHVCEAIEER